jgi:hypothetical protein
MCWFSGPGPEEIGKDFDFSILISINIEIGVKPEKIARSLKKSEKISGGRLDDLEQLLLLALGLDFE